MYEAGKDAQTRYGLFKLPGLNIGLSTKGKVSVMVQKDKSNSWIFLDSISEFLNDGWQLEVDNKLLDKLKKY